MRPPIASVLISIVIGATLPSCSLIFSAGDNSGNSDTGDAGDAEGDARVVDADAQSAVDAGTPDANMSACGLRANAVGWWRGDGDTTDSSANPHSTSSSNFDSYNTGVFGQAFSFGNGEVIVTIPDPTEDFLPGGSFSAELWVFLNSTPTAGSAPAVLISKNEWAGIVPTNSAVSSWWVLAVGPRGKLQFWLKNSKTPQGGQVYAGKTMLVGDQFYHVVVQRNTDSESVSLYVDGRLDMEFDNIGSELNSPLQNLDGEHDPLTIGGAERIIPILNPTEFSGRIDEVAYYNYALTPVQIDTLFNNGCVISQ